MPACDIKSFSSTTSIISKDDKENKEGPTPGSTPTSARKNRRRSNLFTPSKKSDDSSYNKGSSQLGNLSNAIQLKT